ncbi:putative uncharacterized protein [Helicobacter pylori]|nr:hypothetical protein [Helicobacter pylori]BAW72024.1 putative uncharacterized protein [Helicobacter pylori]BAW75085.1 putative uncharacterized protein [Helicobacter pylori]
MVDKNGNVISNTLTQSKFVGRNGAECFEKFLSKDYEKYLKNGVKMEIPKDFFGDFQKEANIKIKSLESQIAKQKSFGDFQKVAKLEEKLQKCKIIKANTRQRIGLSPLSLVIRTLSWDWVRKNSMSEAIACQGLCGISIN